MIEAKWAAKTSAVFVGALVVSGLVAVAGTRTLGTTSFGSGFLTGVATTAVFATVLVSAGRGER
jgi:hypothetical protein